MHLRISEIKTEESNYEYGGITEYIYDNCNRLQTMVTNGKRTSFSYDALGNIISSKENIANIFCCCWEQLDAGTAQYYLRARFYNPVIGRFSQQDTYLNDGLNLYAYCQNNPVSFYDPTGHNVEPAIEHPELPAQQTPQYPMVIPQPGDLLPAIRNNDKQLPTLYNNNPLLQMQNSQVQQAVNNAGGNGGKSGNNIVPSSLLQGEPNTRVYLGIIDGKPDSVCIAYDVERRQSQHGDRFDYLREITTEPLTRRQVRTIEQAMIKNHPEFSNKINSISIKQDWYDDAIAWGEAWLKEHGLLK